MNKLDELEKLAKSSYSQSTVHVEIGELLDLIDIAKAANELIDYWDSDEGPNPMPLIAALAELERGE
jgi:hypothetical protein